MENVGTRHTGAILDAFSRLDINGEGTVHRDELCRVLRLLDPKTFRDDILTKLVAHLGFDEAGFVSYSEFVNVLFEDRGKNSVSKERLRIAPLKRVASNPFHSDSMTRRRILDGYTSMRRDLSVAVRCLPADLRVAEMLAASFRAWQLRADVKTDTDDSPDELTVWLVTPAWDSAHTTDLSSRFDCTRAVLLFPAGMKHSAWVTRMMAEGIDGPFIEVAMRYHGLCMLRPDDFDIMELQWLARLWRKLVRLQGVIAYSNDVHLGKAIYRLAQEPEAKRVSRTSPDSTPHVVGFVGSTAFFCNWTGRLMRYFADELMLLQGSEKMKEIIVCTGGFRNMNERNNAENQGVGYTVGQRYFELGGQVIHVLPEVANERDFSAFADQLKDGSFLPVDHGLTVFAGKSNDDHLNLMALVCDVIFLVEGGPGAATQAKAAILNSNGLIPVVPVRSTGGAAAGMFDMPKVSRPFHVEAEAWALVADESIVPTQTMADEDLLRMARAMGKITFNTMHPLDAVQGQFGTRHASLACHDSAWLTAATAALESQVMASVRICILGSSTYTGADSELLVQSLARKMDEAFPLAVFVTGGLSGVQETFAKHCGDGSRVWNLVPHGRTSNYGMGQDVSAGTDHDERRQVFGALGDVYVCIEGGPGVSQEASEAFARGASIVPLMRTGGASSGMYDFPKGALERPNFIGEEHWALLESRDAPVEGSAAAAVSIVAGMIEARMRDTTKIREKGTSSRLRMPHWELSDVVFAAPLDVINSGELAPFHTLLKLCEKGFRTYGTWNRLEETNLLRVLRCLKDFLERFVELSRGSRHIKNMKKAYMERGSKFRRVYDTLLNDVVAGEATYAEFVTTATAESEKLLAANIGATQTATGSDLELLLQVYRDAFRINDELMAFCEKVSDMSGVQVLRPPLKGMWRSIEKMVLKYGRDGNTSRAAAQLKDVSRAGLQGTSEQLLNAIKKIVDDEMVCLVRIKNRFANPSPMGWADCQIMFYFVADASKHICEIQLVHRQLMLVRSNMGAHHEYGSVRAAAELLRLYGEEIPSVVPNGSVCERCQSAVL